MWVASLTGGDCTAKDEAEDGKEEPGETLFCIGVEGSVAEKPPSLKT